MKITKEIKNKYITVRFNNEIMPMLKLSKEDKAKFEQAIKANEIYKR